MLTLYTVNNPHNSIAENYYIDLLGAGIEDLSLTLNINAPHELDLTINTDFNSYYELLENPFAGILLIQDDGLRLSFIKEQLGQKSVEQPTGVVKIRFVSTVTLLQNTRLFTSNYPLGFVYEGGISNFYSSLCSRASINFISTEKEINYLIPIGSVYDTFNMSVDSLGNYSWRDYGVNTNGNLILEVGRSSDRPVDENLIATNLVNFSTQEKNTILIKSVLNSSSGETLTHLRPIGNKGVGGDLSSTIFISQDEVNSISQDPEYPLVESKESLANGKLIYDILNTQAISTTEVSRPYVVNITDYQVSNDTQAYNQTQQVYNQAVNFLKTKNEKSRKLIDIEPNKIIMSGTRLRVNFSFLKADGKSFYVNEILSIGSVTYDKDDLIRIINNN